MLLLCLVACAALAAANTTPDTTGGQIEHAPGYTFGSKVGGKDSLPALYLTSCQ
jgi:hypothetical protein